MRPIVLLGLALVLAAPAFSGCKTAGGYLNEQYPFASRPASFTLAVAPAVLEGPLAVHTDTVAADVFSKPDYALVAPAEVRALMAQNTALALHLGALALHRYTEADVEAGPNASAVLSPSELAGLREALGARYLLLPTEFRVGGSLGVTAGAATYRLYDLEAGSLIYERSRDLNVNVPGEPGQILLSAVLIGGASDEFRASFLSR
jgi:hypothetical protein